MRVAAIAASLLMLMATAAPGGAQPSGPPASLSVQGQVRHPLSFTAAELARLPPTTVESRFDTEHGPEHATYTGVLLWTLLGKAGLVNAPGRKTYLQHTIMVRGRDGYMVALSVAELDPGFEGKPVVVAYAQDGKPAAPGLRLVVPLDKEGGRSVKDLVAIEVR